MAIVIIYESEEWSNSYLRDCLVEKGKKVNFLNFEEIDIDTCCFDDTSLIVNRLFPSSYFRDHKKTYFNSHDLMEKIKEKNIPMINSYEAFLYDFDKIRVCSRLFEMGLSVPEIYCTSSSFDFEKIKYPCIVKPNRGGRSQYTYRVSSEEEMKNILKELPEIEFLFQEYIQSIDNYTIRVEVIGKKIISVVKRSMDEKGISSYHRGAFYEYIKEPCEAIRNICFETMEHLNMSMAGIDLIESSEGLYVIDVNSTSNYSKKFIDMLGYNPMDEMVNLIIDEYNSIKRKIMI
jgi:ribosomal protein S6--L-glutamate ligase